MKKVNIPGYIIKNLKAYGNVAIGAKTFPGYVTNEDVIQALERQGLKCRIVTTDLNVFDDYASFRRGKVIGKIIELVKKG